MKSFSLKILTLIVVVFAVSKKSFGQQIKFKESKQNFGFVHEGDTVRLSYELKNIGSQPLVISDYEVECGCTKMESVEAPIQPGASYIIKVSFDTHEKYDRQDRTLKIISNAKNSPTELCFKGVILKPKKK